MESLHEPNAKRFCLTTNPSNLDVITIPKDILIRILVLVKKHILCFRVASSDCLKLVDQHSFLKIFVVEHRLLKKMSEALHLVIKVDENLNEADGAEKYDQLIQDGWYYKMLGLQDPAVALKLLDENKKRVVNRLNNSYSTHINYKVAKSKFLLNENVNIPFTPFFYYKFINFCNRGGIRDNLAAFIKILGACVGNEYEFGELWKFIIKNNPKLAFQAFKQVIETSKNPLVRELINQTLVNVSRSSLDSFFGQDWKASIELAQGDDDTELILLDPLYRMLETQLNLKPSGLMKDEVYKTVRQIASFNCSFVEILELPEDFRLFNRSIGVILSFNTCQILEIVNQMVQVIDKKLAAATQSFDQNKFLASYIVLVKLEDHRGVQKLIEKYRKCLLSLKIEKLEENKIEKLKENLSFTLKLFEDMETFLQEANEKTAALKFNEIAEIYSNMNVEQFALLKLFVTLLVHLVDQKAILKWINSCNLTTQIKILELLAEDTYFKEKIELLEYTRSFIPKANAFSLTVLFQFLPLLGCLDVNAALMLIESLNGKYEQFDKKYKIELLTNIVELKNLNEEPSDNHLAAAQLLLRELDDHILLDNLESYLDLEIDEETSDLDDQLVNLREILESFIKGKYIDSTFNFLQKIENVLKIVAIEEMRNNDFIQLVEDTKRFRKQRLSSY